MMNKEIAGFIMIILVLFSLLFGGAAWLSMIECDNQTSSIGFDHDWKFLGGCMIEVKPGQWIPLDNWRNFD
jgi:hypothetical protein